MEAFLDMAKALADGNRVRVVGALRRHEELCVRRIVELLRLATPTVSRHMAVLHGARQVTSRKEGRWVYYRLSTEFPVQLRKWIEVSLLDAEQIKADQVVLANILASSAEDLCKNQKERKD